jgi:hypothetical protein
MSLEEMEEWNFTNHDGVYTESQLDFLIYCLVRSGYLEKPFDSKPYKAVFC